MHQVMDTVIIIRHVTNSSCLHTCPLGIQLAVLKDDLPLLFLESLSQITCSSTFDVFKVEQFTVHIGTFTEFVLHVKSFVAFKGAAISFAVLNIVVGLELTLGT